MIKKSSTKKWWILMVIVLIIAIYLNRSYAYFYDFLEDHQIMPLGQTTNFTSKSQNNSKAQSTYLALGDSLTKGVGVDSDQQTYPYLVAQKLATISDVKLINLGIPGARTNEVVKLELPKISELKPSLITLLIGTNDAQSLQTENAFRNNYQIILDGITTNTQTKVVVLNIPPLSHNIIFPYKYFADLRTRRFNSIIDNLVTEKEKSFPNLIFINLYEQTKNQFNEDQSLYSADKFHPGAKGYKLWSEIINANLGH